MERGVQVQREIRIHSQLQHESIIAFYGAFEDSEHVYLALEYAAGEYTPCPWPHENGWQSISECCISQLPLVSRRGSL